MKLLKQKGQFEKALIIAPLRVCHMVWPAEGKKWTDFNGLKIVVLHGPKKDELLLEDADIFVTNPESLDWLLAVKKTKVLSAKTGRETTKVEVNLKRFKKFGFDILVVDELSKFKHTNTNRFKALKLVLHTFGRRWGLTGSPVANGLLDLFGQCYILDEGRTLGKYITHYRMEYFDKSYDGYSWEIREGADQKIYKRVAPLALRMAAEDYVDMPKVITNNIYVTLPDKVMAIYEQMENHLIACLDGERTVSAANTGSAIMKCRQISSGGLYLDKEVLALVKLPKSQREWENLHNEKIDALEDLIDELQGKPLLVAYDFQHDLDRLRKRFGKDIPVIGGGTTTKRSIELEGLWNAGSLPFLFGHPQSIGHGLNMQDAGCHICHMTPIYDYDLYDQYNRRVWRSGNKNSHVTIHHIIAKGTIDEIIVLDVLEAKKRGQKAFFDALKKLSRSRK